MGESDAWEKVKDAKIIYAVRGKKVMSWEQVTDSKPEILKEIIGRSGNLRAPTLQIGEAFVVGFQAEIYTEILAT